MPAVPSKFAPCLSCRDPVAAIALLTHAFELGELLVVPDGDGGIAHAERYVPDVGEWHFGTYRPPIRLGVQSVAK